MLRGFRSWFSNLSGFAKVTIAAVVAVGTVITAIGTFPTATNEFLDLYERVFGSSLELVDKGFTQAKAEPTKSFEAAVGENYCGRGGCPSPALDFTVVNSSEDSILIKRADVQVKKIWTFKPPYRHDESSYHCGVIEHLYMAPSYNYDVELKPEEAPYTISKRLSQNIEAGKTDRFTITLQSEELADRASLLEVAFIYGQDDDVLPTGEMLYGQLTPFVGEEYSYHHFDNCWPPKKGLDDSDVARLTRHNKQAVSAISRIEAPRNATLTRLLQTVSGKREYNQLDPDNAPKPEE